MSCVETKKNPAAIAAGFFFVSYGKAVKIVLAWVSMVETEALSTKRVGWPVSVTR